MEGRSVNGASAHPIDVIDAGGLAGGVEEPITPAALEREARWHAVLKRASSAASEPRAEAIDRTVAILREALAAEASAAAAAAPKKEWRTARARAMALGVRGTRMPTGFAALDTAMRGGPLPGRLIVIGGAPGAGKTSLALQIARHYHGAGHPVAIVAADEEADGLLIRWGQQEGLTRDDLERGNDRARSYLAEQVDSPRLLLVDQDEEGATLEDVVARLSELAKDGPPAGVLIVDSIQSARVATGTAESPRERIEAVLAVLRRAAKVSGFLVIATSEMARGFYRGGGAPGTEALAAFKESGAIEYSAGVALAMTNVPNEPGMFEIAVAKNRLGDRPTIRLRMDSARATFSELEAVTQEELADEREAIEDAKVSRLKEELLRELVSAPGDVRNQHQLRALVRGSNVLRARAVAELQNEGRIVGGGKAGPYRVVSVLEGAAE